MTNWEQSLKLILLQLHEKLPKNSVLIILWSFGVRGKLERWRKLISGNLMSWPKTKKIVVLKCDLLFYTTTTNHSSIVCNICVHIPQSHVTKIGLYVTTGSSLVVGLRRSSKGLPEPHMHQKMVTLLWSVAGLIHSSFLNPSETITSEKYAQQISEVHRKPQCLQLTLVNRKDPILLHSSASKAEQNWAVEFCLIFHTHLTSCQPITTSKYLDNFLQGKWFYNQQDAENAFQGFIDCMGFYTTGINLFLIDKKY